MSAMEKVVDFLEEKEDRESISFWQVLGPLFLLFTLAIAANSIPLDLLFIAGAGLYLSARWQMRGCAWSLALLALGAAFKHSFIETHHLWALGLEGSLACSFFITALGSQQSSSLVDSLFAQMETRDSALQNLEEEMGKKTEEFLSQQVSLEEKLSSLQKEHEDLKTEHSSMLVLNEVLRKISARLEAEKESLSTNSVDQEHRLSMLLAEIESAQKELSRIKNSDVLAAENKRLQDELNAIRYQKEQAHQVNETLVRHHGKEALKVKEAHQEILALKEEKSELLSNLSIARVEIASLSEHLEQASSELEKTRVSREEFRDLQTQRNFLQERLKKAEMEISLAKASPSAKDMEALDALKKEHAALNQKLSTAEREAASLRETIQNLQKDKEELSSLQQEKTALKDKLSGQELELEVLRKEIVAAKEALEQSKELEKEKQLLAEKIQKMEEEISSLRETASSSVSISDVEAVKKERDSLSEMLILAQEKIQSLSQIEPLYVQLKKQFAEKNEVLQQTRADLFKADTELQALKLEKEQTSLTPSISVEETQGELERLDREIAALEEENQQLQELISQMTGETPPDASKRKKRPKSTPPGDQDLLF